MVSDKFYAAQWTPEQVDQTVALANANFEEGADKVKRTVMAVYKRKKMLRLERDLESAVYGIHDHFS